MNNFKGESHRTDFELGKVVGTFGAESDTV